MALIKLGGSDGGVIEVEQKVASMSCLLKQLLSDEANKNGEIILIKKADSATLTTVMAYCQKHAYEAEAQDLEAYDKQFKEGIESFSKLFKLINASDYLAVEGLLELTIQKAVEMMENLSVEEVRDTFMLPRDDFTEEEEAKIRKRFAWAFQCLLRKDIKFCYEMYKENKFCYQFQTYMSATSTGLNFFTKQN